MLIPMPRLSSEEKILLESSETDDDWRFAVNRIKLGREGQLPPDWNDEVINSGVHMRVLSRINSNNILPPPRVQDAITGLEL